MTQPKLVSEEAISIYDLKDVLKGIDNKDTEAGFRAQKTNEYIEDVAQLDAKVAKGAYDDILALNIPRIKRDHIVKIIDINPVSLDDLKQLVSSFNITVKDDYLKKVLEIIHP